MSDKYIDIDTGSSERGLWCERCQLPSVIRVPITTMTEAGVYSLGFYTTCNEHGDK